MQYEENGKVIRGVGGLFEIQLDSGTTPLSGRRIFTRAKGNFRHVGLTPLPGDRVRVTFDDTACPRDERGELMLTTDGGGAVIAEILTRKNALIRPPMANLDLLLITVAAAEPAPVPETIDKLISIAEFNGIEPILVIGKCDIDPENAAALKATYELAGFPVFLLSAKEGEGVTPLREYLAKEMAGKKAPVKCPVCDHPQAYFQELAQNY